MNNISEGLREWNLSKEQECKLTPTRLFKRFLLLVFFHASVDGTTNCITWGDLGIRTASSKSEKHANRRVVFALSALLKHRRFTAALATPEWQLGCTV
jgi:hypothetical protein